MMWTFCILFATAVLGHPDTHDIIDPAAPACGVSQLQLGSHRVHRHPDALDNATDAEKHNIRTALDKSAQNSMSSMSIKLSREKSIMATSLPDVKATRLAVKMVPVALKRQIAGVPLSTGSSLPFPKQCALVSNSVSLTLADAGKSIDAVDGIVARINDAPTTGFERHVGNRTELMIVNDLMPCKWKTTGSGPRAGIRYVLVNDFANGIDKGCVEWMISTFPHVHFFALEFAPMNSAFLKIFDQVNVSLLERRYWVTTGLVGAAFLLNVCEEVRHYGFLAIEGQPDKNNCREHYWDTNGGCSVDIMHRLSVEHLLWPAISSKGRLPGEGTIPGWPRLQRQTNSEILPALLLSSSFITPLDSGPAQTNTFALSCIGFVAVGLSLLVFLLDDHSVAQQMRTHGSCVLSIVLSMVVDLRIKLSSYEWHAFDPAVLVLFCEMAKLLITMSIIVAKSFDRDAQPRFPTGKDVALFVPSSILFSMNNVMLFQFIARVDLSTFALLRETAIVWTALWWVGVFRTSLGLKRFMAIVGILLGGLFSCTWRDAQFDVKSSWVIISPLVSALGAVTNDFALKRTDLDINMQNAVLYTMCAFFALLYLSVGDVKRIRNPSSLLAAFPLDGVSIIVLQSMMGLVISRILKHADAVTRQMLVGFRAPIFIVFASITIHTPLELPDMLLAAQMALCSTFYMIQGPLYLECDPKANGR